MFPEEGPLQKRSNPALKHADPELEHSYRQEVIKTGNEKAIDKLQCRLAEGPFQRMSDITHWKLTADISSHFEKQQQGNGCIPHCHARLLRLNKIFSIHNVKLSPVIELVWQQWASVVLGFNDSIKLSDRLCPCLFTSLRLQRLLHGVIDQTLNVLLCFNFSRNLPELVSHKSYIFQLRQNKPLRISATLNKS